MMSEITCIHLHLDACGLHAFTNQWAVGGTTRYSLRRDCIEVVSFEDTFVIPHQPKSS